VLLGMSGAALGGWSEGDLTPGEAGADGTAGSEMRSGGAECPLGMLGII